MTVAPARIDQVIPSFAGRDAIGQHTLRLRDVLRAEGFGSEIFYVNASTDVEDEGRPLDDLGEPDVAGRWLLYQLSIGSHAAEVFARRPERKLVNYHNITPAELLRRWEPEVGEEVRVGRSQLLMLAPHTDFAIAVSGYNEQELVAAGYGATAVAPLLIDYDALLAEPDRATSERLVAERAGGGADLLFVGKVGPHKAEHDLVMALTAYRRLYDPRARLRIVGGGLGTTYPAALERFADAAGVADAVDFAGSVTHGELAAYFQACDVFVCMSEHEGFCVPLVEAMAHRLPIVAYGAAAVPDTVADAGLVLPAKDPALVAAAVHRVVTDEALRSTLADAAAARVEELSLPRARARTVEVVRQAVATAGCETNAS